MLQRKYDRKGGRFSPPVQSYNMIIQEQEIIAQIERNGFLAATPNSLFHADAEEIKTKALAKKREKRDAVQIAARRERAREIRAEEKRLIREAKNKAHWRWVEEETRKRKQARLKAAAAGAKLRGEGSPRIVEVDDLVWLGEVAGDNSLDKDGNRPPPRTRAGPRPPDPPAGAPEPPPTPIDIEIPPEISEEPTKDPVFRTGEWASANVEAGDNFTVIWPGNTIDRRVFVCKERGEALFSGGRFKDAVVFDMDGREMRIESRACWGTHIFNILGEPKPCKSQPDVSSNIG